MIVLDASAAIEMVLGSAVGREVAARVAPSDLSVHAPHLLLVEGVSVIRRLEAGGVIDGRRAREAVEDLGDLDVEYYDHAPLVPRMWALRHNLTAYDAAYVALAEGLDAALVTTDGRIATAPGHRALVDVVSV